LERFFFVSNGSHKRHRRRRAIESTNPSNNNTTNNNYHPPPVATGKASNLMSGDGGGGGPTPTPQFDAHRFEKISNIVKQFKLSCGKAQSQFQGMDVCNSKFTAFIDAFTANAYITVIVSHPIQHQNGSQDNWGRETCKAVTLMNIQKARSHFEQFIPRS